LTKLVPMKIVDTALWQAQKAEIAARPDAESGCIFLAFCEDWCDAAEGRLILFSDGTAGGNVAPIEALRDTLEPTQEAKGSIPPGWLGQLLLVICSNWAYGGDDLFDSMNPLEQRFVGDAAFVIHNEANLQAETVPDAPSG
jgi:hypothetical protein